MDILRDLICTMCERDKRVTKFALIGGAIVGQDVGFFNFVLRPGEAIERSREYELIIRPKGQGGRNGQ